MKQQGASMAGESDPSLLQAIGQHMPWIASVGVFIAGMWSAAVGWMWRRQVQRGDDHGRRIRELERTKADRAEVERLQQWLRDDVGALHDKLDRALGNK